MYKIVACDLDETLLRTDRTISKKDKEAILKARELGVKFVPATGRGFHTVQVTLKDLGLYNQDDEYVISFNGGAISENKDNKLLSLKGISFEVAEFLFKKGLTYDVCIHLYTIDTVYAYKYTQQEKEYLNGRMEVIEIFDKDIDFLRDQQIVKVLYMNTDYDYLTTIEKDIEKELKEIAISYSSNRYIEFNHLGVSKGEGLLSLAKLLGVKQEETIAIGDNFNDLSMIKMAGLGVGVQNVAKGVMPYCDYICDATHNESAVAEVINQFILKAKE